MSNQQLLGFMEKLVHEVPEGLPVARRVRLMSEGTVFETWEPVLGIDPDVWAKDVETLIQALLSELPKRRVQLQVIAEDSAGATLGTYMRTVTGTNPSAQDLGTQNGAKALADALASVAKTADAVGEQARRMMDFQAGIIEKQNTTLFEYHELFMAIKKAELDNVEEEGAVKKIVSEQLTQALPILGQLAQHLIEKASKTPAVASAINGAAATVANVTNGAH